jgi:hypothetical protein
MKLSRIAVVVVVGLLAAFPVFAADAVVTMNLVNEQGVGKSIGTITISEGPMGQVFTPKLTKLAPGLHGFHVHQNPDCAAGMKDSKQVPGLAQAGIMILPMRASMKVPRGKDTWAISRHSLSGLMGQHQLPSLLRGSRWLTSKADP